MGRGLAGRPPSDRLERRSQGRRRRERPPSPGPARCQTEGLSGAKKEWLGFFGF